ncbi:Uncharacterised protein [Chlamydia trachomatis]|nr:Uncharacterised protein [Chlamydia trachomatis]
MVAIVCDIPKNVQIEYKHKKTLCKKTNNLKIEVLAIELGTVGKIFCNFLSSNLVMSTFDSEEVLELYLAICLFLIIELMK